MSPIIGFFRHASARGAEVLRGIQRARNLHEASYRQLLIRFAELYVRRKYSIREIFYSDLLAPRVTSEWLDRNLGKQRQFDLQSRLNPKAYWILTEDKNVFYRYCAGSGLTIPHFFGCIGVAGSDSPAALKMQLLRSAEHVLKHADVAELIVKPALGVYGRGVVALRRSNGYFVDTDGAQLSVQEICDRLATTHSYTTFVVQERLRSHPELERLSGTGNLQTIRMVTYVSRDGKPFIGCCQLKIIGEDSLTDNYGDGRRGNMIADIPLAKGKLANVFQAGRDGMGRVLIDRHPRTGIPFRGFSIPFWDHACRLVESAALAFLPLRTIGWDVAVTADGPVLIEGNVTWDPAPEGEVGGEILGAIMAEMRP